MIAWETNTAARNLTEFPSGLRCFNKIQLISSDLKEHLSIVLSSEKFSQYLTHAFFHPWLGEKGSTLGGKETGSEKVRPVSFPRQKRTCNCKQVQH